MDSVAGQEWNEILRHQRKKRSWTQEQLADELYKVCGNQRTRGDINANMISRWELGKHPPSLFYQEKLCYIFELSPEEFGFLTMRPRKSTAPSKIEQAEGSRETGEEDDMNRRQVLQIFGVTGTSIIAGDPSNVLEQLKDIEVHFNRRNTRLHSWLLDGLERETHLRWHLYYTSSTSQATDGLSSQIDRLEQLADDLGPHQKQANRLLAQCYQLAGSLARDNFSYTRSKKLFDQAYKAAEEAEIKDLAATSIARLARVHLRQEDFAKALTLSQSAANLAGPTELYVNAYILNGLAEAYARNSYRDECYRTLDQAEVLLNRAGVISPEDDVAQVRLTLQSIEDTRGECFVLCGEPEKGLKHLQAAQKRLDPTISRNHCQILMQQSEAHLAAGHPDYAVKFALEGLRLALILQSKGNTNWASEIYTQLVKSVWKDEPVVKELEEAIRAK